MKKLNLSLLAILTTISLMPQSALISMEQPPQIEYIDDNTRIVNGQRQIRYESTTYYDDGTESIEEIWINAPSQILPQVRYPGH